MRRRAIRMTVTAVLVAVLILGIPAAVLGVMQSWRSEIAELDVRVESLALVVSRSIDAGRDVDPEMLDLGRGEKPPRWRSPTSSCPAGTALNPLSA